MATFRYTALDSQGRSRSGHVEADTRGKAFQVLRGQGLTPTRLDPVAGSPGAPGSRGERGAERSGGAALQALRDRLLAPRLRLAESLYYLSIMLQTGSALTEALEILGRMAGRRAGTVWLAVRGAVATGVSFSQALQLHAPQFPREYVRMVRVAEGAGNLGLVLERIAAFETRRSAMGGKLLTALVYPSIIMLVGLGAVYFLLVYVMPDITRIFATSGQALPVKTQLLLVTGETLQRLGPAVFLLPLLGLLLAAWVYEKHPGLRLWVDRRLWRIGLLQKDSLARFANMLGFQLEAGIALVQAMEGAAGTVRSAYFRSLMVRAQQEVMAGQPLDKVLAAQGAYPDMFLLSIAAGQKSGTLGLFVTRLSQMLEQEVDNALKRWLALAEPAMILVTGVLVGFIVLAIMEPIFNLSTQVR